MEQNNLVNRDQQNARQNVVVNQPANLVKENIVAEPIVKKEEAEDIEKLSHSILVNEIDRTDVVEEYQLKYTVDAILSNPQNKRFQNGWEGMSLLEVFEEMTERLGDGDYITFSNGTKTSKHTKEEWAGYIGDMLDFFDCDDKSKTQNVWINVSRKSVDREEVELSKL